MTSSLRSFFLKLTTVLIFGTILSTVLFFANGYNYDFVSQEFRKTGALNIKYADSLTQVFLNGEKLDGKLPFVASNILPGTYDLVVAKDGFWNWKRKVKVIEDLVSTIDDVVLYPQNIDLFGFELWKDNDASASYFLSENYVFKLNGSQLLYGKLDGNNNVLFSKLVLPFEGLISLKVENNDLIVKSLDNKIWVFQLEGSGGWKGGNNSAEWNYSGGKWLYFNDHLLAIYDSQLNKVENSFYTSFLSPKGLSYFDLNGVKMFKVSFGNDANSGDLLLINKDKLNLISANVNSSPYLIADQLMAYSNTKNELLTFDLQKNKLNIIKRFSEKFQLMGYLTETKTFWINLNNNDYFSDLSFDNFFKVYQGGQIMFGNIKRINDFYLMISAQENKQLTVYLKRFKLF